MRLKMTFNDDEALSAFCAFNGMRLYHEALRAHEAIKRHLYEEDSSHLEDAFNQMSHILAEYEDHS